MKLKIELVPWNYYVLRRKLVLDKWIVVKNLKSKKELCNWCKNNGIEEPEKNHSVWTIMKKLNTKPVLKEKEEQLSYDNEKVNEVLKQPVKKLKTKRKNKKKDLDL